MFYSFTNFRVHMFDIGKLRNRAKVRCGAIRIQRLPRVIVGLSLACLAVISHGLAGKSAVLPEWCAASRVGAHPAFRSEAFLGQEAALVVHLAGVPDPVAEVDIGEAHAASAGDVI